MKLIRYDMILIVIATGKQDEGKEDTFLMRRVEGFEGFSWSLDRGVGTKWVVLRRVEG